MRKLILSKTGINKIKSHSKELKSADFEGSIKSCHPGEWCLISMADMQVVGFINPLIEEQYSCFHVLGYRKTEVDPLVLITERILKAYERRARIKGYLEGCRLFYGISDGIPGLIIDTFENINIIQINTAGIDKYREEIKTYVKSLNSKESYLLDNIQYRSKEYLPVFDKEVFPDIHIKENNLKYALRSEVLQKVGFYYDHRENRRALSSILGRFDSSFAKGVDLFSYIGAWGTTALSAGCQNMDFVDQGDFAVEIEQSLQGNGLDGRGSFFRNDVFKFMDDKIKLNENYDIILSDPPAFAKNINQKKQALEGYSKLHRKVFKLAAKNSLCAFSSCTHYVSHEEFIRNIQDAALKENKNIQLIYTGMQGWDHPVTSLSEKSNYIKSYFYLVE